MRSLSMYSTVTPGVCCSTACRSGRACSSSHWRVSAARELLEAGHDAPKQIAAQCGFANADTLRRSFSKHLGISPAMYRRHQGAAPEIPGREK